MKDDVAVLCRDALTICDGYECAFLDSCAWCCTLETGHSGPHRDEFEHNGRMVMVAWCDEEEPTTRPPS